MVVDTSALIALLEKEPVAGRIQAALVAAQRVSMSAATLVEASIVADSKNPSNGIRALDVIVEDLRIAIIPLTREHAIHARAAYLQFGKGRHPAGLNFGDCFSYALSRALGEPLLFIGRDFGKTDVEVAAY